MKLLNVFWLLIATCFTISSIKAQNNYTNFKEKLSVSVVIEDITVNSKCSGSVEIFAENGELPYRYSIDGGATFGDINKFNGLCQGKYFVHVRDNNGDLGLALVEINNVEIETVVEVDTFLLIQKFNNATTADERRKAQANLSTIGVKYPVEISKLGDNKYSFPLLFLPKNKKLYESRILQEHPNIITLHLNGSSLEVELQEFSDEKLTRIVSKLGYEGFTIKNN